MWTERASVVIPVMVQSDNFICYLDNFIYCFESALQQTVPAELIIVDYGCAEKYAEELKTIIGNSGVYIRAEASIWSRGRALNLGIFSSNGEYVFFVDADCVLPPDYVDKHLEKIDGKTVTISPVYDTTDAVVKSSNTEDLVPYRLPKLRGISHMAVPRDWFDAHQGFDPEYKGWGAEDNDLLHRMADTGLKKVRIDSYPYHLWHPTYKKLLKNIGKVELYNKLLFENRKRFFQKYDKKSYRILMRKHKKKNK